MNVEDAMRLSTHVAIRHQGAHAVGCVACALMTLADEVQDLRLASKRMRKNLAARNVCTCGQQLVDGICGSCNA